MSAASLPEDVGAVGLFAAAADRAHCVDILMQKRLDVQ